MPARASVTVDGRESRPDPVPTDTSLATLRVQLLTQAGTLINEAARLGGEGQYRQAMRRETYASALLDTVTFLDTGRWNGLGDVATGYGTRTPSEELARRFELSRTPPVLPRSRC